MERDDVVGRFLARQPEEGPRLGRHRVEPFVVHEVDRALVPVGPELLHLRAPHRVDLFHAGPRVVRAVGLHAHPDALVQVGVRAHPGVLRAARAAVGVSARDDEDAALREVLRELLPLAPPEVAAGLGHREEVDEAGHALDLLAVDRSEEEDDGLLGAVLRRVGRRIVPAGGGIVVRRAAAGVLRAVGHEVDVAAARRAREHARLPLLDLLHGRLDVGDAALPEDGQVRGPRRLRGPRSPGFVLEGGVLPGELADGVVALLDLEVEPEAVDALLCDADPRGQAAAVVASRDIARRERGHQAVGEAPLGLLEAAGHRLDHLAPRERVPRAGEVLPARRAPVDAAGEVGPRGIPDHGAPLHVDEEQLTLVLALVVPEEVGEDLLGVLPRREGVERRLAPLRVVPVLGAEGAHAGPHVRHDLAHGGIAARHRGAADARLGVHGHDREGAAHPREGVGRRDAAGERQGEDEEGPHESHLAFLGPMYFVATITSSYQTVRVVPPPEAS